MEINVTGTSGKLVGQLKEAAEFYANLLMDPRMVKNLTIDIEISDRSDVDGECVDEDGIKNPRWFTIGLKKQSAEEMLKTLGHEMVHVKQHAKNELQSGIMIPARGGHRMTSRWMGQIWKPKAKEHDYFDSPWEIEAFGREVGLYQRWVNRDK